MKLLKKFIAIDGPNGVGKSTIINILKQQLNNQGLRVVFTKEPTSSALGNFIRENQDLYNAHTLAALVAADRYDHIDNLIKPGLEQGKVIITDRYIASSLVYQIQDNLAYEFVLGLNSQIILPALYFILTANEETRQLRLQYRNQLTRFESTEFLHREGKLFEEAGKLLKEKGAEVHFIDNESQPVDVTANKVAGEIVKHLNG